MGMERYLQHIKLDGFGLEKQDALKKGKILVIGAGGLGCAVLQMLVAMGVETIGIADNDIISIGNLHRQILYTPDDIGRFKTVIARERLIKQNPAINIQTYGQITSTNAVTIFDAYDVIVDATDNFTARYVINDACVCLQLPFVVGAVEKFSGQISTFNWQGSPTYRDLFPTPSSCKNCEEVGVLGVIPNIIGHLQALEVVKLLTGIGAPLAGQLLTFDGNCFKTIQYSKQKFSIVKQIPFSHLSTLKDYQLVDVRSEEERALFHIGGIHLTDLQSLEQLNPSKPIVVYCRSGNCSLHAAYLIQKRIFATRIYSLEGGIERLNYC